MINITNHLNKIVPQGFPTRKNEAWKYTDLSALQENEYELSVNTNRFINIDQYRLSGVDTLVFIDGQLSRSHSDSIVDQCVQADDKLTLPAEYQTPFTLLNTDFLTAATHINIQQDLVRPFRILHYATPQKTPTLSSIRKKITLQKGIKAEIFEEYVGEESIYFNNSVTQVILLESAQLIYSKLQREGSKSSHIANTTIIQHRNSQLISQVVSLGSRLNREDLNIQLLGEGAHAELFCFYAPSSKQLIDHHTRVDHCVPHTHSDQHYRAIVNDQAKGIFNGKIRVHPGAIKTIAHQSNKNLLLSRTAEMNTKPELEIYNDDVQCTHGAVVGQLDEEALFYLRSRGILEAQAKTILTSAFSAEIIERFSDGVIKDYLFEATISLRTPKG